MVYTGGGNYGGPGEGVGGGPGGPGGSGSGGLASGSSGGGSYGTGTSSSGQHSYGTSAGSSASSHPSSGSTPSGSYGSNAGSSASSPGAGPSHTTSSPSGSGGGGGGGGYHTGGAGSGPSNFSGGGGNAAPSVSGGGTGGSNAGPGRGVSQGGPSISGPGPGAGPGRGVSQGGPSLGPTGAGPGRGFTPGGVTVGGGLNQGTYPGGVGTYTAAAAAPPATKGFDYTGVGAGTAAPSFTTTKQRMDAMEQASVRRSLENQYTAPTAPTRGFDLTGRTRMTGIEYGQPPNFSPFGVNPENPTPQTGFNYDPATQSARAFVAAPATGMAPADDERQSMLAERRGLASAVQQSTENAQRADLAEAARASENTVTGRLNSLKDTLSRIRGPEAGTKNPYGRLVSGGPVSYADLENMTISEVQAYQKSMLAKGFISTAVGAYQTLEKTLAAAVQRLGIDPNTTKFTKSVQDMIGMDLIDNRVAQATNPKTGKVNVDKLARGLAQEWAALSTDQNRSYYAGQKSSVPYSEVKQMASNIAAGTGPAVAGAAVSTPKSAADIDAAGKAARARARESIVAQGIDPNSATAISTMDLAEQEARKAAAAAPAPAQQTPAPAAAQPTTNLPDVNLPARAPKPTSRDQPPYQRSLTGMALATGVDVLSGMTGPLGLAANVISALMTGDTVGGALADMIGGKYGENYYNPGGPQSPGSNDGGGGRFSGGTRSKAESSYASTSAKGAGTPETKEDTTAKDFESKYIDFNDPTWRPTPTQKWGEVQTPYTEFPYAAA